MCFSHACLKRQKQTAAYARSLFVHLQKGKQATHDHFEVLETFFVLCPARGGEDMRRRSCVFGTPVIASNTPSSLCAFGKSIQVEHGHGQTSISCWKVGEEDREDMD